MAAWKQTFTVGGMDPQRILMRAFVGCDCHLQAAGSIGRGIQLDLGVNLYLQEEGTVGESLPPRSRGQMAEKIPLARLLCPSR